MASSEISMPDAPMKASEGRVRWRRAGAMLAAATAAGAVLVALSAQGVLAANFAISGIPFIVTATRLDGTGFEQFATIDNMAAGADNPNATDSQGQFPNRGNTGGQVLVVVSAIRSARLTSLCQSVSVGPINLKITAGSGATPVTASNLVVDSDQLTGNAAFTNINIGQDASTFNQVPGATGRDQLGIFGQQADHVTIDNLRQSNWATTAASFTLPGLNLGFASGGC
jgi:hypothetical protein